MPWRGSIHVNAGSVPAAARAKKSSMVLVRFFVAADPNDATNASTMESL